MNPVDRRCVSWFIVNHVLRKDAHMNRRQALTGFAAAAAATVLVAPARANAGSGPFPTVIPLPDNWLPEGIAIGAAPFAYFGSRADGSIYRANLATGAGEVIHKGPGAAFPAVGLKVDDRARLFVSGGSAGDGRVIHAVSGELLAGYQFTTARSFINDVVLTPSGPFFTNSLEAALYHLPLDTDGRLPAADGFVRLPLSGGWEQRGTGNNANGIARTPDGTALLVVNSATQLLYRVDPATGFAVVVDLGGYMLENGDGLLLDGQILYVVQNRLQILAVIRLNADGTTGTLARRVELRDPFNVPTTVAKYSSGAAGDRLYLPNAKFGQTVTEFEAVSIPVPVV
jgi:sugar lactone lactonase YvrE